MIENELTTKGQLEADLEAIELQVVGKYTLADALRDGASKLRQVHGRYGDGEETGCAWTAIIRGATDSGAL